MLIYGEKIANTFTEVYILWNGRFTSLDVTRAHEIMYTGRSGEEVMIDILQFVTPEYADVGKNDNVH